MNASSKITRISDIKQNQIEEAVLRLATGESLRKIAMNMNINYVPLCFALKAATGKSFKDFKTPIKISKYSEIDCVKVEEIYIPTAKKLKLAVNIKLSREWHPTKNAPLTPNDVRSYSHKKVWWICARGHEWEARIASRSEGAGCPCCSGYKLHNDNCLQTINPELSKEWHPTKNAPLTPNDVTSKNGRKVWWICASGHEWEAVIANRSYGAGCPNCSGYKVHYDNRLQTINPELVKEWHPTKNAPLTPNDVTTGMNKKVWWICAKGHEWEAAIASRSQGRGCPYCWAKIRSERFPGGH